MGPETFIPYMSSGGITEWRVAGEDGIFAHALTGGWYLVRTMGPCTGLQSGFGLGFQPSAGGRLDRYGTIVAEGRRCPIASVTRWIGEPPPTPPLRRAKK
jgi:hypothetical protein